MLERGEPSDRAGYGDGDHHSPTPGATGHHSPTPGATGHHSPTASADGGCVGSSSDDRRRVRL